MASSYGPEGFCFTYGQEYHFGLRDGLSFVIYRIDDEAGRLWEGRCSADGTYAIGLSLRAVKQWAEKYPEPY